MHGCHGNESVSLRGKKFNAGTKDRGQPCFSVSHSKPQGVVDMANVSFMRHVGFMDKSAKIKLQ